MPIPIDPTVMLDLVALMEACAQKKQDAGDVQRFIALANSKQAVRGVPRGLYRELLETSDNPTQDNFARLLRSVFIYCNESGDYAPLDGLHDLETARPKPRCGMC